MSARIPSLTKPHASARTGTLVTGQPRIGVVGATGAVGTVTLALLAERGYEHVRAFASTRSAGSSVPYGDDELLVEEATTASLGAGDVDLFLFSVGTSASRELVPVASAAGAICVDKSSAYRLVDGCPLVVPEVNGARALEALERDRIVANPNCCTIPLTCVLKPLHDQAGLERVRVSTYQSVSGAGAQRMAALGGERSEEHDLAMDWKWEGDESDEEAKLRAETRKILELPRLPVSATCVRVPVMVGHSEAVWVELERPLTPDDAAEVLRDAPSVRVLDLPEFPTPRKAAGTDDVLVGRIRRDTASGNGIALYLSSDNLRKGAALNAIQIAELLLTAAGAHTWQHAPVNPQAQPSTDPLRPPRSS
jgi:aspartate-semialdehyde dehydrogenase